MPHFVTNTDTTFDNRHHVGTATSSESRTDYSYGSTPKDELARALVPSNKRKRLEDYSRLEKELIEDAATEITKSPPKRRKQCSGIRLPSLVFPKSQYEGYVPPLPVSREKDVLTEYMVQRLFM